MVDVCINGEVEESVVYMNGEVDAPDAYKKGLGLGTELRRRFVFCCSGLEFC